MKNNKISGQKFGKLTALDIVGKSKNRTNIWLCSCDCGGTREVKSSELISGDVNSCGCYRKIRKDYGCQRRYGGRWKGYKDITGTFWRNCRNTAYRRSIPFNITKEDIWQLYLLQGKMCYLSGLDISFANGTASIDRIDSDLCYSIENVSICHRDINTIKSNLKIDKFLNYCKLITMFDGNFTPIKDCSAICKVYIQSLKYGAKKRNLNFLISEDDIIERFLTQGGLCALSGLNILFATNWKDYYTREYHASVDRIDNNIGYEKNNIQIVHKELNVSRMNLDIEYYKKLCSYVYYKSVNE